MEAASDIIDLPKVIGVSTDNENPLEGSWESQLIEYSMGVMSPTESLQFERQLNECRTHVKLAAHYSQVVGWVGASAPASEPPAGHKNRLMTRIASAPQERTFVASGVPAIPVSAMPLSPSRPTLVPTPALPTGSDGVSKPAQDLNEYRKNRALSRSIAMVAGLAAALVLVVAVGWLYSLLSKPYIPSGYTAVLLQPQNDTVKSSVVAFVNPDRNDVVLLGSDLAQLPAQKVYELWVIPATGKPQAAGIFTPGQSGQARHEVQVASNIRGYAEVAVTIEDAPGSQEPTTLPILVGKTGTQ